jgi:hypothetical protein
VRTPAADLHQRAAARALEQAGEQVAGLLVRDGASLVVLRVLAHSDLDGVPSGAVDYRKLGAFVAQHVGFVVDARNALARRRVALPLPLAECELSDVLRIAQHFADARMHPTGTSSAPSAWLRHGFGVQALGDRRVAEPLDV